MKLLYCTICGFKHKSVWGWQYRKWETKNGQIEGWGCTNKPIKYEFTTDSIKSDRKKYFKDLIQPYRQGEFSNEFKEAYPERAKSMVKEGVISQTQYDKAKNVWYDLPGFNHRDKSL